MAVGSNNNNNAALATTTTTTSPPRRRATTAKNTISFSAIVVIAANTMNGPGLTTLPEVGDNAGLVTFVILVTMSMIVTSFVISNLCNLIWTHQKLDHQMDGPTLADNDIVALSGEAFKISSNSNNNNNNDNHHHHHPGGGGGGSTSTSTTLLSRKIASIAMVGCALALALAQMMLCAKIADAMIVASIGKACGISPIPSSSSSSSKKFLHCTSNLSMKPFTTTNSQQQTSIGAGSATTNISSPPMFLITLGLLLSSSITISLASVDQSSMITAQYVLFGCLILACIRFCYTLSNERCTSSSSIVDDDIVYNSQSDQQKQHGVVHWIIGKHPFEAVGSILFNFAFVVTAPPLVCDANSMNHATYALIVAITIMGILYSIIGWIGAPAAAACSSSSSSFISDGDENNNGGGGDDTNLLSLVLRGRTLYDILAVIVFGLSQLAAIPVYCELAKETLDTHLKDYFSSSNVNFWLCHALPWLICAITYNSELFESFVEWSSLLLLGFANFSLPLLLDLMLRGHHGDVVNKVHQPLGSNNPTTAGIIIGRVCGPTTFDSVLWMYAFVSGGITSVIMQRMTNSTILAVIGFVVTIFLLIKYHRTTIHHHNIFSKRSSDILSPSGASGIDLQELVHKEKDEVVSTPTRRVHKNVHIDINTSTDDDQMVPFMQSNILEEDI